MVSSVGHALAVPRLRFACKSCPELRGSCAARSDWGDTSATCPLGKWDDLPTVAPTLQLPAGAEAACLVCPAGPGECPNAPCRTCGGAVYVNIVSAACLQGRWPSPAVASGEAR